MRHIQLFLGYTEVKRDKESMLEYFKEMAELVNEKDVWAELEKWSRLLSEFEEKYNPPEHTVVLGYAYNYDNERMYAVVATYDADADGTFIKLIDIEDYLRDLA